MTIFLIFMLIYYYIFSMAYTQSDLDNVRSAINTIASKGAAEVQYADGRRVRYQSLKELRNLLKEIEAEVNAATYGGAISVIFKDPDAS